MYLKGWFRVVVTVFATLAFVSSAAVHADLTPIGPFTGELSENWESFPTIPQEGAYLPDPTTIMGGAATISNAHMVIYEPGIWEFSLSGSGYAQVVDGQRGMGVGFQQTATISFSEAVAEFGAYWGAATSVHVGEPALINVTHQ